MTTVMDVVYVLILVLQVWNLWAARKNRILSESNAAMAQVHLNQHRTLTLPPERGM